jgi:hypothetical protein
MNKRLMNPNVENLKTPLPRTKIGKTAPNSLAQIIPHSLNKYKKRRLVKDRFMEC